jgi:hypothetical protein
VTIVTAAAIYATVAAAFLCGDPAVGAAIGATFGVVRALSLLPARGARDGEGLRNLYGVLGALERPVRRATPAVELLLMVLVIVWLI